jgi:S-formylglutathione hydrolase FrmB
MTMLLEATAATADNLALLPDATAVSRESRGGMRVPLIMPDGQEFYWDFRWQQDERETLADDESVVFDSEDPEDAAKWLREPDDEDE